MPTQTAFWDKIADKYDGKVVKGPNYAARIERAAAWVGPDASVLDVGCAGGHITIDLAERVRAVHGIDISPRLIALARRRLEAQGATNCTFAAMSADDPALPAGQYDAVTAYSLLHLVPDAPATVRRFFELVRPGGRVIAEVPTTKDIGLHLRVLIKVATLFGKAPVVKVYSQARYEQMFRDAGFVVDEVKVYNPKSMSRSLLATRPA